MVEGFHALTDKEKQTLRLLIEGHDAKSSARHLGLSVHTINERLRDARRKLGVSSSREAARLVRAAEGGGPEPLRDTRFGDAAPRPINQLPRRPIHEALPKVRALWVLGGTVMIFSLAALLIVSTPASKAPSADAVAQAVAADSAVKAATDWLALVDSGRWAESYAATAASFRQLNTVAAWQSASERVRVPLGRVVSRTLIDEQDTPAPPNGYRTVRFRTDFANRTGVVETLSLDRDSRGWHVVGIYIG
jgi:DNA-binding CsgD family transcriptional regulator